MQRLQLGGVETLVALMAASRRQGDVGAEPREGREPKYRPGLLEPRTRGGLNVSRCPFLSVGPATKRRAPE